MDCSPTLGRSWVGRNRRGRRQPASCSFGFSRAELPCASAGDKAGWRAGSPARRSSRWGRLAPAVNSVGKSAMTSGSALVLQVTGAGRVKGIRWGWPRNCRLNGKTERKWWDERDGVVTFGQRWTMATKELAGVAEQSPELGKMTESTSDSRDRPHHGVELDEGNSMVVSHCTGSARSRRKSSPEVRRNLVNAKFRRGFVGARVIETGWGWRVGKRTPRRSSATIYWSRLSLILFSFFF
jgi:hypothetical protein